MIKSQQLSYFLSVFLLTLSSGFNTPVYADDTEIYLGVNPNSSIIKHNILFVLDTSQSMKADVISGGTNIGSRISILQSAMNTLISGLDNANVGYMRMNGALSTTQGGTSRICNATQNAAGASEFKNGIIQTNNTHLTNGNNRCYLPTGAHVMFPIADLDASTSSVSGEPPQFSLQVPVSSSSDDAQQSDVIGSVTNLTEEILDIGSRQCAVADVKSIIRTVTVDSDDVEEIGGNVTPGSAIDLGTNLTGFRFLNITDIEDNDAILNANITFTANTGGSDDMNLTITGGVNKGAIPDSTTTFSSTNDVSARTTTSASISWSGVPVASSGESLITPDLTSIVQELVSETGPGSWDPGDAMVFLFDDDSGSGATGRSIHDVSSDNTKTASLTIEYCDSISIPPIDELVGLRFQDLAIPQGAMITSAFIDFTASVASINTDADNLALEENNDAVRITAHDVDDSDTFGTTATNDVRVRNNNDTSARVDWRADEMGIWTEGDKFSTPDIKTVVDEVIERNGWCGGNDMTFVFEGLDLDILRRAKSYDDDPANAPVLRVSYNNIFDDNDTGCNERTYHIPIAQSNHDAKTKPNSTDVNTGSPNIQMGQPNTDRTAGYIFTLPVEKDTTIVRADLQFTAKGSQASDPGTANLLINAEASDNATNFNAGNGNLGTTARPRISAGGISWDQDPVATNASFKTPDIAPLISAVTSRAGWTKDSKIAFFVTDGSAVIERKVVAYDGSASDAAKLNITVREDTTTQTTKTVRERLLEINDSFTVNTLLSSTPSIETLYEASLYWRGKNVFYGKERGQANLGGIPHSAVNGVDYRTRMERITTSHPGSYTGGTYNDGTDDGANAGGGIDCEFETTRACLHDSISGTPIYKSPIDAGLGCSGNFQIFLTDGAPTSLAQSTIDAITGDFSDISSCSRAPAVNRQERKGQCAVEMVKHLNDNDLSTLHDGTQNVTTYTIAFNLSGGNAKVWLEQISAAGGGSSYEATSVAGLLDAFDAILNDIISRPTSFAAPSIAANSFNRLFSRDEVYYGMLTPEINVRWDGNVKKYRICDDTDADGIPVSGDECTLGDILQNDDVTQAVVQSGPEEGLFRTDATSVWSALQTVTSGSGREVSSSDSFPLVGGAGGTISDYTARTIYTEVKDNGSGADETASLGASLGAFGTPGYKINSTTWDDTETRPTREQVCPVPDTAARDADTSTTQCIDYMEWLLGKDIRDEDEDGSTTDTRWSFSDVLHSSPVTVTYGQTTGGEFIDKIIVGTNEGGLRFINGSTGQEEWVFMPNALLELTQSLYANAAGTHQYGIDASPVLRFHDENQDGTIDPADDFVHVYFALRRGGNKIYALDITPGSTLTTTANGQIVPKFLWTIDGDSADFNRLSYTFSDPVLAKIGTNGNTPTDVLMFGGGYDINLDTSYGVSSVNPNDGNAIYIVDANFGTKILDISSSTGADIVPPLMKHSIASEVRILDPNGDGLDDRLYVGDMGGNVWRVDLNGDITYTAATGNNTSGAPGTTVVGRLASVTDNGINGDSAADDDTYVNANKRRFFVPPSVIQVSDDTYSTIKDYDYVLIPSGDRANPLETTTLNRFYAFRDTTIGNMTGGLSGNANLAIDYPQPSQVPIKDDGTTSMIDISAVTSTGVGLNPAAAATKAALGWYLDFNNTGTLGEKGLAAPITIAGTVFFTSYVPTATSSICDAAEGSGRAFALDILSANPAIDWDGDGDYTNDAGDVVQNLGAGIPSEAVPIFTEEGVTLLVGTGGGAANLGEVSGLPRFRTYWYEENY